jgi:hypothetical protein
MELIKWNHSMVLILYCHLVAFPNNGGLMHTVGAIIY